MTVPEVVVPTSVAELARVLRDRPDAVPVGGGTLEVPRWADPRTRPATAVLLAGVEGLASADRLGCGAAATLHTLATDPRVPQPLGAAARSVAGPAVRSLATVGGNVAQAAPGCLAAALLALGAEVELLAPGRPRGWTPLADAFAAGEPRGMVVLGFRWRETPLRAVFRKTTRSRGAGPPLATVAACRFAGGRVRLAVAGPDIPPRLLAVEAPAPLIGPGAADAAYLRWLVRRQGRLALEALLDTTAGRSAGPSPVDTEKGN